ncbi:Vacuolar protein sorting-associated protein 62 [Puccinia graminis f. sp. tritici]|uniref:Vacuolar protein sorting-associated protein 62 n=1 Tax=Puccinia graminis f. sp. tritici TaxID=56615 RepID=A0A5B0RYD9_PUCGR|nr:Vacuolar protein sorting-associated protein 62 [Puccinia graminis f. sp. tritici]
MIRFKNGKPMYVAPEAHGGRVMLGDSAFNYNVLEHLNGRPVVYAANGTHGMYPQPGQQNYTGLPVAIYDVTDKGHLWDPTLNYKSFFFSNEHGFSYTADTPLKLQSRQRLGWLRFLGYWGDQKPELSNPVCPLSTDDSICFCFDVLIDTDPLLNSIKLASVQCAFTKGGPSDRNRNRYQEAGYVEVRTVSPNRPYQRE